MKKEYFNPTTTIINIEMIQMIASSVEGFDDRLDNSDDVWKGEDALSREFTIF